MKTFKVHNYKGIKGTVEVSTNGTSIVVQGKNAAGKSSFVDAITELFDPRGKRLTPRPVHEGEKEAYAEFTDTEQDVKVVREWGFDKEGNSTSKLSVYALDGARHSQPAQLIADLTGGVIFDPSKFLQMDPKPQRDALLRKVGLPFDLDQLEREENTAEDERLKAGQAARAAEGAVTNAEQPAPGTPDEPVSTNDLVNELSAARAHNARLNDARHDLAGLEQRHETIDERIEVLSQEIDKLQKEREELVTQQQEIQVMLDSEVLIDTSELESKVQRVDEINRNVQIKQTLKKLEQEAIVKRDIYRETDEAVKAIQQRKQDGLKQAVFPDPHLSVDENGVLYDGVPFSQANSASRHKAAFSIATSGDADLKLVIVKDGDLLDEESLMEIDEVAAERGFTVLIERGRPDVNGLVATFVEMQDGKVK